MEALPAELLCHIFAAVAGNGDTHLILPSRAVCRRWRDSIPPVRARQIPRRLCAHAAATGAIALLQWAKMCGGCAWGAETCAAAARGGQIETLRWLRLSGCPW